MKYYRLILVVKEGQLLISDIHELFLEKEAYESGVWDKPITKIVTPNNEFHFISFVQEYLESFIAGLAVAKELEVVGWK
jgi:hypothetical protein